MAEKMAEAKFTMVITQGLMKDIARMETPLPEGKAMLGRMGVDTDVWVPESGPRASPSGRILSVGRLHFSKGHDDLLKAVAALVAEGMKLEVRLAGDGPQRRDLEDLAGALGLEHVVRFLGSLPEREIIEHMKWADVFVLASHAEPLGVVYMEAMSMEVPTIGTRAGGVGEIITDGVDGLLPPPKDPKALAEAIRRILTDRALRARLASAGRKTIVDRFDSRIGAATLYRGITGKTPVA
jgi:colanic acid/amylovoran biosynthesis glycosyltransferase